MADYNRDAEQERARREADRAQRRFEAETWRAAQAANLPLALVRSSLMGMVIDIDAGEAPLSDGGRMSPAPPTHVAPPAVAASETSTGETHAAETEEEDEDEDQAETDGDVGADEFDAALAYATLSGSPIPLRARQLLDLLRQTAPKTSREKLAQWLYNQKDKEVVCRGKRGQFVYAIKDTIAAIAPIPKNRPATHAKILIDDATLRAKIVDLLSKAPTDSYERMTTSIFGLCEPPLRTKVRNNVYYLARMPIPRLRQREDGAWEATNTEDKEQKG